MKDVESDPVETRSGAVRQGLYDRPSEEPLLWVVERRLNVLAARRKRGSNAKTLVSRIRLMEKLHIIKPIIHPTWLRVLGRQLLPPPPPKGRPTTTDQGKGKGRSVVRPMGTVAYRGKGQGKGKGRGEGRLGQGGRGRSKGGEKLMGTTAYGGKGSKGRAANGDRPVGAASCRRDHHTMASCQNPPKGASGPQLVVKGTSLRSRWAPKAPNRPQAPEPPPSLLPLELG